MATSNWILDPAHSEVNFKIRYLMVSNVTGSFEKFDVQAVVEDDDFSKAKIVFVADASSVTTNNEQRDQHLKSPDFFDSGNYPEIRFVPTNAEAVDNDGSYILNGDLTIKDVTKPVKVDVEFGGIQKDPWGNLKAGFTVNANINRDDFDLKWNTALETGGVLLSDDVHISCEIQLRKHIETKID